ncbi:MAG: hypothetical protein ABIJ56_01670 [Pseudomonadota bacterium]
MIRARHIIPIMFPGIAAVFLCGCFNFSSTPVQPNDFETDEPDVVDWFVPDYTDVPDAAEGIELVEIPDSPDLQDVEDAQEGETEETGPECGNGEVEEEEECDDGRNGNPDDGCTDECTYSCHDDPECDDGEMCNGAEACGGATHMCRAGAPREDGFVCGRYPRSVCVEGECGASLCGDGFVDTGGGEFCEPPGEGSCRGDCITSCTGEDECADDGNICNGGERCDLGREQCVHEGGYVDGTACSEGPRKVCIAFTCQESACGDGYADGVTGEECDDANVTGGDGCEKDCLYSCHGAGDCEDGLACTDDACDTITTHMCSNPVSPADTVCRPAAGGCDVDELCDGMSSACPMNAYATNITVCREAVDACDATEFCTGSSIECPDDAFQPEGTECDDGSTCTESETCDGSGACAGEAVEYLYDIIAVASGYYHTCALNSTGGVKCWGRNDEGQLGDGTNRDRLAPVDVIGLDSPVTGISAGGYHTCAILETRDLRCWGRNEFGQLGNGSTSNSSEPVEVSFVTEYTPTLISCGRHHTCVLLGDSGQIYCWGRNDEGQLGNGTIEDSTTPIMVEGLARNAVSLTSGRYHTCAILFGGEPMCWGMNGYGELGDGTTDDKLNPVPVADIPASVLSVAAGGYHSCAALAETGEQGNVMCWGRNNQGQLGDGTILNSTTALYVQDLTDTALNVTVGGYHTCVMIDSTDIRCWGQNDEGQIGDGTTSSKTLPVAVTGLPGGLLAVSPGFYHTCGLLESGGVMCWGGNGDGELGDGTTENRSTPVDVLCQ